jgi:hypothetical protein
MYRSHGIRFFPDETGGAGEESGTGGAGEEEEEEEEEVSAEEAKALREENEKLKADANKRRTEAAREAKAAKAREREAALKGGEDELRKQLETETKAREQAESRANQAYARSIAAELGCVSPGDAVRLLDFDSISDPGNEREVKEALTALLEEKPFLKTHTKPRVDGGAGTGGSTKKQGMNEIIRSAAGR